MLLWLLAESLFDLLFSGGLELLLEKADTLDAEREERPFALIALSIVGLFVGLMSAVVLSHRVLPPGSFTGISLIGLPVFLGSAMEVFGQLRGPRPSHLATWQGGAALGFGLAAGRLAILWSVQ